MYKVNRVITNINEIRKDWNEYALLDKEIVKINKANIRSIFQALQEKKHLVLYVK